MHCSWVLDQEGVGQLIKKATEKGLVANPSLKVSTGFQNFQIASWCESGGGKLGVRHVTGREPSSVAFFDGAGLDYVSCSAFRVPIARLTAAQVPVQAS
ncbi:pyruvate, orthophosphate dikinase [Tanacetum coccineum]|uniref:Pyruvate, orthophosphate dikinase n=1 Tax=Tanacetum coccineum TaxID=301880 RepID=A0ABQ4WAM6_9ASTR